jgi:hypothetical protein
VSPQANFVLPVRDGPNPIDWVVIFMTLEALLGEQTRETIVAKTRMRSGS